MPTLCGDGPTYRTWRDCRVFLESGGYHGARVLGALCAASRHWTDGGSCFIGRDMLQRVSVHTLHTRPITRRHWRVTLHASEGGGGGRQREGFVSVHFFSGQICLQRQETMYSLIVGTCTCGYMCTCGGALYSVRHQVHYVTLHTCIHTVDGMMMG